MDFETLLYQTEDRVTTITLNRPERRNAFNSLMARELAQAWQAIKDDPQIGATQLVLMTLAGHKGDLERARQLGFAAYLTKPIKHSHLRNCLEMVLGAPGEEGAAAQPAELITRDSLGDRESQKARILLVEDSLTNQKVTLALLKHLGYRAVCVSNGKEALDAVANQSYDIVLMDCQMPVMDGYTATRRIREFEARRWEEAAGTRRQRGADRTAGSAEICLRPHVPIIALTAHAMVGDRERCLEAGMDDYIAKPVDAEDLATILKIWHLQPEQPADGDDELRIA